jgi:TRAP-type C4-dicarboxylate transport system substrate-binding protein
MKKRIMKALALLVVIVMAVGLTACGGSGNSGTSDTQGSGASSPPAGGGTSNSPAAPSNAGTSSAPPAPATSVAPPPAPDAIKGDPVYLTWAHPFPALHHHNVQIVEPLAKELYEKSNGLINITVEPGGTITTGTTAIADVTTGAVDMMWTHPGYTPGRFPPLD